MWQHDSRRRRRAVQPRRWVWTVRQDGDETALVLIYIDLLTDFSFHPITHKFHIIHFVCVL